MNIIFAEKYMDRRYELLSKSDNDNCTFTVSGYELSKGIEVNLGSAMESELILYCEK
jgi:hypothetical protein